MKPGAALANALLATFFCVLAGVILYIYYAPDQKDNADLRRRVENKLYDIRTRLSPDFTSKDAVAVIAIDEESIAALSSAPSPEKGPKNLTARDLTKITRQVLALDPENLVILLPSQVFHYEDDTLKGLVNIAKRDRRIAIGTFGLERFSQDSDRLPAVFTPIRDRIFTAADDTREFRRNVVRKVAIYRPTGMQALPFFIIKNYEKEADFFAPEQDVQEALDMRVNYLSPTRMQQWSALDVNRGAVPNLAGKTVYLGLTAFRPWTFQDREATHINTPWQSDGDPVEEGLPVVFLQAMAGLNIIEGTWLTAAPLIINLLQTVFVATICLLVWRYSVGFASFLIIGFWCFLIVTHSLMFSLFHLYVPLADAIFFSALAAIAGGLWKLRLEGRQRALQEARASSERQLAKAQERFLDRFATELAAINQQVYQRLNTHTVKEKEDPTTAKAFRAARESCEELRDYLGGIEQFAKITGDIFHHMRKDTIDLKLEVEKILRQFATRRANKNLQVHIHGDTVSMQTDRTLYTQILFNLISNAIKYSPQEGQIDIRLFPAGNDICLSVSDQGPGIAPENQEKIFEKFYRVKDDNVYKIKGHGLGLYLSRYFATRIGASIQVESEFGTGTTFTLCLPFRRAK